MMPPLVRYRYAALISQTELAELSGVGRDTINRIERGHVTRPTAATAGKLCAALRSKGVDVQPFDLLPVEAPASDGLSPSPVDRHLPPVTARVLEQATEDKS